MTMQTNQPPPTLVPLSDLQVGDRVSRRAVGYLTNPTLPDRTGTVIEVYHPSPQRGAVREDWILYAVLWDDTSLSGRGYMREGLERVPLSTGGLGL